MWGVAHFVTGRRIAGSLLLALYVAVAAAVAAAATVYRSDLLHLAVQPDVLQRLSAGLVALGVVWVLVVIRSYQILRPLRMAISARALGAAAVAVMCFAVGVPVAWSAHSTYVYRDALTSIFRTGSENGRQVDTEDPFNGQARVNILLLGGDSAADRTGVRTDSMTLASVDTETGDTVLLSLPRNLEHFPMPPGPARDRFPYGFTGDGPLNPGLLNEVYEYAEQHPDVVPGVPKNHRGPELLKATIAGILGLRVDYYILVDMFGFADIVDAMGGVRIKVTEPIPYGLQGAVLQPGYRKLDGKEALWYGRSRTNSSDYVRMGRQKCLMRAIAEQADPQTVLTSFDKLAAAAKRTLATDIPQELLPALVKLSNKVKDGAEIRSLQFVPPLIYSGNPDFKLIRKLASDAVNSDPHAVSAPPSGGQSGSPSASPSTSDGPSPDGSEPPKPDSKPVSLEATCP
ncbi:LCP family protein [Actinomadura bangladeshensis]|uniref:LCP family protein n=1 Tax=Actinomadura bangladeshensis TaxID=453573 RepID=UPI0030B8481C